MVGLIVRGWWLVGGGFGVSCCLVGLVGLLWLGWLGLVF